MPHMNPWLPLYFKSVTVPADNSVSHVINVFVTVLICLSVVNEKIPFQPSISGFVVMYISQTTDRDGILWRRLITLICAGWLPHDLAASWSCLSLWSEVRQVPYSYRTSEGSPERDRVSTSGLGNLSGLRWLTPWLGILFSLVFSCT